MKHNNIEKVLFEKEEIAKKIKEVAKKISEDYKDKKDVLVVGILKGSFIFMSDLVRELDLDVSVDFIIASSYGNRTITSGELKITKDLTCDVSGKHIIIAEDIIDSGITLNALLSILKGRGAASVKVCSFLDKKEGRLVEFNADYICFDVPNAFLVGYGLDYAEKYRELPYVGILKKEIYE